MHLSGSFYSLRELAKRLLYEPTAATVPDVVRKRVMDCVHLTSTEGTRVGQFRSSHSFAPYRPADAPRSSCASVDDQQVVLEMD